MQCATCGVVRHQPYPTARELSAFYDTYLKTKQAENPLYLSDKYWEAYRKEKDLTFADLGFDRGTFEDARVLDVGCAVGQFIEYVEQFGAEGEGIDVSSELVAVARRKGRRCALRPLAQVRGTFDLVSMWHVIEHVPDPVTTLRHVHRLLKPGGSFLIETPCTGVVSEAFGQAWRFYMPIEHLHLFSQEALTALLVRAGFDVVSWVRFGSGHDTGTIPALNKRVCDTIAKRLGIGDTIALWARRRHP